MLCWMDALSGSSNVNVQDRACGITPWPLIDNACASIPRLVSFRKMTVVQLRMSR